MAVYTAAAGSRLVMLLRLMARVEALCSSADVVGGRMPATPKTISAEVEADDRAVVAVDAAP